MIKTQQLSLFKNINNSNNILLPLYLSPNPNISDLCNKTTAAKEVHQPYKDAIVAGKNSYVYDAHTYHTKIPPEGIELLIEHYTRLGDVVLDMFCGSGMTGVAASRRGRNAILIDISPAACFISYNLNTPIDHEEYLNAVYSILADSQELEISLYGTYSRTSNQLIPIDYMVWSYGLLCSNCHQEFVLWDVARDEKKNVRESKILSEFSCPHCQFLLKKRGLKKTKRYPVLVGYRITGNNRKEESYPPKEYDITKLKEIENQIIPENLWYPTNDFPMGVNTQQPIEAGITSIDKAYTPRALYAMSYLWHKANTWNNEFIKNKLLFTLTSLYKRVTVFSEFRFWGGSGNTANFNVPAIMNEQNLFKAFERKAKTISWYFREEVNRYSPKIQVSTQSACKIFQLPDNSVDYIFTDPPFGKNINYSEMNFLWESWLQTYTNNKEEAIINKFQGKSYQEYTELLTKAFTEGYRVLKNNGWMTVVFHNSSAQVWQCLQKAIADAGFSIEGTQTFDKKQGTFKQFVSAHAVGYDLVLHCSKKNKQPIREIDNSEICQNLVRKFIQMCLTKNPDRYYVKYLHVRRADELDFRRLYAEWLQESLSNGIISFSFDEFRSLCQQVISENQT